MGKLTYVIERQRPPFSVARVVLDGTTVHASHPDDVHRLVPFENASDKEALQTFQKVIQKYFHPRDGWTLKEKKPGVADLSSWAPAAPSKEELAAAAAAKLARQLGYGSKDGVMVLDLSRQKSVNDLEIALERADGVSDLWVLTSADDLEGTAVATFLSRLELAAPKLRGLYFESPWQTLGRASAFPLTGLGRFLEKRRGFERLGFTGDVQFGAAFSQPKLTTLRLCSHALPAGAVERIARGELPELKTLHLGLTVEGTADNAAVGALLKLPFAQLEVLTLTGLPDVTATLQALTRSGRQLPKTLLLDGSHTDDAALIAARDALTAKQTQTTVRFGESIHGRTDEETRVSFGEVFASPFAVDAHDVRAKALWQAFA